MWYLAREKRNFGVRPKLSLHATINIHESN